MKKLSCLPLVLAALLPAQAAEIPSAIEALHSDVWKRFAHGDKQTLLLDYEITGPADLPTAEEFQQGKPNALAWWTPLENGPFFNGLYIDGILRRWKLTGDEKDRAKARALMEGLLLCASVGNTPGFIARGVVDGHYHGIGSDDQTAPWFYGLWRYLQSGAATPEEKSRITAKMVEVGQALEANRWLMPVDPVGDLKAGQFRGGWTGPDYRGATRLAFVTRILHELTGDSHWKQAYENCLVQTLPNGKSRLQVIEEGMPGEWNDHPNLRTNQLWIYVVSQAMVNELAALEESPEVKKSYLASLRATANAAAPTLAAKASPELGSAEFRTDWRVMNDQWRPQTTPDEAATLAIEQIRSWKNRGREVEIQSLREPACAAWIAFLHPDKVPAESPLLLERVGNTPWPKVRASFGFLAETAWHVLQDKAPQTAKTAAKAQAVPPASSASNTAASPSVVKSQIDLNAKRCTDRFTFVEVAPELRGKTLYILPRGSDSAPGAGFRVKVEKDSEAWLLAMDKGAVEIDMAWEPVELTVRWNSGNADFTDKVFHRRFAAGEEIVVPEATSADARNVFAIPHALVVGDAP